MYEWRKMTPEEQEWVLTERIRRKLPRHTPPHLNLDEEHTYLISAACYDHKPIIGTHSGRLGECAESLISLFSEFCIELYAWCILPNHYHFLVKTNNFRKLGDTLGKYHGRSSRKWNLEDKSTGRKVWCSFMERGIRSERHLYASLNYIHHNPVKHGYVERWQDWPFGSAREYLDRVGHEKAKEIWIEYPILDYGEKWDV